MIRLTIIDDGEYSTQSGTIGWAYARRARALAKYKPNDFAVVRFSHHDADWDHIAGADVVFNLDYALVKSYRRELDKRRFQGVYVVSMNKDSRSRQQEWGECLRTPCHIIVNNRERYEQTGRPKKCTWISNGVDVEDFYPTVPIGDRPHRAIYAGGTGRRKQKGWAEVLEPLESSLYHRKFETHFRRITEITEDQVFTTAKQRQWYNSGSYVLCASATEGGGPGIVMEGMACGCVPICTAVGSIPEYIEHQENGVICERTPASFIAGLEYAREHRERLSAAAAETMRNWSYGPPANRASLFFDLFRKLAG